MSAAAMNVEMRHLRAFTSVATHRSFTMASRELMITQPALTRTVQQLETVLQVRLIARNARPVELTDVGRRFLERARRVLAEFDRAMAATSDERELRLGFHWVLPHPWAQLAIERFEQATAATVTVSRCADLVCDLGAGEVDVVVLRGARALPGLTAVHLFDEDRVAAVSARSPLAARQELHWDELGERPLVVNTVYGSTQPEQWAPRHRPQRIVTCSNFDEWLELVRADHGVGAVPASVARPGLHPGVALIPLVGAPSVPVRLLYRLHQPDPLLRRFLDAAVSAAHEQPAPTVMPSGRSYQRA
ncbi:LysR family transcriptional regulator [Pseudonocardia alaniniphila]|uniref:LysR family transcriptional regulator n=1 Tax=Pseudonocardia alaniniphila TaxID=75291 RepID=A0ABS9TKY5_9PSEU|nr:LysR family transcriptional regulator [Pseudonocardia alaniniphila]MCH6169201.1 LysR family transcriptional regulator [Pseudonocardia alaniniphila]